MPADAAVAAPMGFYEKCGLTPQKIRMETILC